MIGHDLINYKVNNKLIHKNACVTPFSSKESLIGQIVFKIKPTKT